MALRFPRFETDFHILQHSPQSLIAKTGFPGPSFTTSNPFGCLINFQPQPMHRNSIFISSLLYACRLLFRDSPLVTSAPKLFLVLIAFVRAVALEACPGVPVHMLFASRYLIFRLPLGPSKLRVPCLEPIDLRGIVWVERRTKLCSPPLLSHHRQYSLKRTKRTKHIEVIWHVQESISAIGN